jgi:hypothetical protein
MFLRFEMVVSTGRVVVESGFGWGLPGLFFLKRPVNFRKAWFDALSSFVMAALETSLLLTVALFSALVLTCCGILLKDWSAVDWAWAFPADARIRPMATAKTRFICFVIDIFSVFGVSDGNKTNLKPSREISPKSGKFSGGGLITFIGSKSKPRIDAANTFVFNLIDGGR